MQTLIKILYSAPDETLLEVATGGERVAAYMRLITIGFLWLCTIIAYFVISDPIFDLLVAVGAASVALFIALFIYFTRSSYKNRTKQHFIIGALDVSVVSFTLIFFALNGKPETTINSMVIWELYLLFIIASSLFFDARVCIATGAIAFFQYLFILLWVTQTWDMNALDIESNLFTGISWYIQICRLVLLLITTLIAIGIVFRGRKLLLIAGTDPLTGLENRRITEARLIQELSRALREESIVSIAYLDIDYFKKFNDTWGHAAGDKALKYFAHNLKKHVRTEDIVSRWGGEEFVVIFPNTDKHKAKILIERIQADMKGTGIQINNNTEILKFSAGISQFSDDGMHQAELIHNADIRLKIAKETGRDKVVVEDFA